MKLRFYSHADDEHRCGQDKQVLLKNKVILERGTDMEWLAALIINGMIFFIRYEKIVSSINTFD
jgi:hypothetical protein